MVHTVSPRVLPGHSADVAVIGAGVIGLSIAWELQRAGHSVLVVDPEPASGASFAAAGMLAPVTEFHFQEEALQRFMLESSGLWPDFAARIGQDLGYRSQGALLLGADHADRAGIDDLMTAQSRTGLPVKPLNSKEIRALEPFLAANSGGYLVEADHQVDPRKLCAVLLAELSVIRARAISVEPGAVILEDGSKLRAAQIVVANGLAASQLGGLPLQAKLRPVHGDIMRLTVPPQLRPFLSHTIRGVVRGKPVYLLPRQDGTVVLGATQREDEQNAPSAGAIYQLLRDAQTLIPAVSELALSEVLARARPATPDNAPLLGRIADHLVMATGFFRHGVLLAPAAARSCLRLLTGQPDPMASAFAPERFNRTPLAPLGAARWK
ncbi:glycine oxidase [Psychromicrobium silvestre]|uniref:glycine oxidase n=1 Tax=Psychromicrobium silvestre TaxID=1645614 RepID=A0A7Y9S5Q7_9MICC|nr:glycine oxidase ThiO [Psychromicrobium silvestre]NYE95044.1 glycine oxidase [Psychromicrobium silvestre]